MAGRRGHRRQTVRSLVAHEARHFVLIDSISSHGRIPSIHAHAAGFMDFEPEIERVPGEVDESLLKICFDTGYHAYAGLNPVTFMQHHSERISCIHSRPAGRGLSCRTADPS